MAQVVFAASARADLDRLFDFLAVDDPAAAIACLTLIDDALSILERHPLMGRPAEEDTRELVISQGRTGYVALYKYVAEDDVALVLALRHQREAGFSHEH